MNTFRNNLRRNFTTIPNALILDNTLSDRARFMFCYMASKPDDWVFYQANMARELGYSVDTARKYIDELIKAGWMTREMRRNDKGKYDSYDYVLLDHPCGKNTDTVNIQVGKNPSRKISALTNKDFVQSNYLEQKTIETNAKQENEVIKTIQDPLSYKTAKETFIVLAAAARIEYPAQFAEAYFLNEQQKGRYYMLTVPTAPDDIHSWLSKHVAGINAWALRERQFTKGKVANETITKLSTIKLPKV